jgi:hypothetical protein
MKKLISFLFLFGIIGGASLTAQSTHTSGTHTPTTYTSDTREIRIIETSSGTPVLKSAPAAPLSIEAWLTGGDQVEFLFQGNWGTVAITVTGAQGVVYQTSVSAAEGAELTISTQGWPAGGYVITLVRSSGQTYTGNFEL